MLGFFAGRSARATDIYQLSEHSPSWLQLTLQPQDRFGDLPSVRSGKPNDTNSTASEGRSNRNDRVIEVHEAIVTGKLVVGRWSSAVGRTACTTFFADDQ